MQLMFSNMLFRARHVGASRLLAVALAAASPGLVSAGVAGVLKTDVKALSTEVTYSSISSKGVPLVTYIGYELTTSYTGTNTTNNVQLVGELTITDPAEVSTLVFDTANSDSACSAQTLASPNRVRLTCNVGTLRQGSGAKVFQVFFKAPRKEINGVADGDLTDSVTLTGTTLYAEQSDGAGNTNNAVAWNGNVPVAVTLGTTVSGRIKSVLPKSGGKLFSGNGGIASGGDVLGTSVTVPAFSSYVTTEIVETVTTLGCINSVLSTGQCLRIDLTINDGADATVIFANKLSITISIDQSILPQRLKPQEVIVKYDGEVVGNCQAAGVPRTDGKPCINSAVRIKDSKDPDRNGDIEIEFLNYRNGSFSIGDA